MNKILTIAICCVILTTLASCGGKKKSDDIIAPKVEKVKPQAPIRMQEYANSTDVDWIGKKYVVEIERHPSDSLSMVTNEYGQKFVDNIFKLSVKRSDGSTFFSHVFSKKSFSSYLDDDFRKTGVFEGLVLDKADGDWLIFGASVGHPQTDEYIPLVIRLSRMGELTIKRDLQMDTENTPTSAETEEDEV